MAFEFEALEIPGVVLIKPKVFPDQRGFFLETYKKSEFSAAGIDISFVQDNSSHSVKGALRGLHYQKNPKAQGQLIGVLAGTIFDVAVDIRKGSPTYGRWVGATLSDDNRWMVYVPPGCAHGFCVLSHEAEVSYKTTSEYAPEFEAGILWNDPQLDIRWPIKDLLLSDKDAVLPLFKDADNNFVYDA